MNTEKTNEPLLEWNRLNKENAEQEFVSALYASLAETTNAVDRFSLWLLAGTGASGALLIAQIKSVLPFLTAPGFKVCMALLVTSSILGFLAKYRALRCEIQVRTLAKLKELLEPIFEEHEESEDQIQKMAEVKGVVLQTDLDMEAVISEFSKPFSRWVRFLIQRQVKKAGTERQAGYHIAIKQYVSQLRWTFLQSLFFLAFLITGAWFARAI